MKKLIITPGMSVITLEALRALKQENDSGFLVVENTNYVEPYKVYSFDELNMDEVNSLCLGPEEKLFGYDMRNLKALINMPSITLSPQGVIPFNFESVVIVSEEISGEYGQPCRFVINRVDGHNGCYFEASPLYGRSGLEAIQGDSLSEALELMETKFGILFSYFELEEPKVKVVGKIDLEAVSDEYELEKPQFEED